jgi:hypothetical protein
MEVEDSTHHPMSSFIAHKMTEMERWFELIAIFCLKIVNQNLFYSLLKHSNDAEHKTPRNATTFANQRAPDRG